MPLPPEKPKRFDIWRMIRFCISYIMWALAALCLSRLFALMESYSTTAQNLLIPGTPINAKYQLTQDVLSRCRKNYNEILCGIEDIIRYRMECFALTQCLNYAANEWNLWGWIWDETWRMYEEEYSRSAWIYFFVMLAFHALSRIVMHYLGSEEKRFRSGWGGLFATREALEDVASPPVPATETGTNAAPATESSNNVPAGSRSTNGATTGVANSPEAAQFSPNEFREFRSERLADYESIRTKEQAAGGLSKVSAVGASGSIVPESVRQQAGAADRAAVSPRSLVPPPLEALSPPLIDTPQASSSDDTFVPPPTECPSDHTSAFLVRAHAVVGNRGSA